LRQQGYQVLTTLWLGRVVLLMLSPDRTSPASLTHHVIVL